MVSSCARVAASAYCRCRVARGASTGLLLGGWLYQVYGPIRMFELQATGIGVACVLYFGIVAAPHALKQRRRSAFRTRDGLQGQLLESPAK